MTCCEPVFLVCAYFAVALTCILSQVSLIEDPNRASEYTAPMGPDLRLPFHPGFLALAQLPPVFLFATKNSIASLLLGPGAGYERLNFLHRWAGRGLFLGGLIHGSLWLNNYISYGLPILGQQKTESGIACLSLLCIIILTSLGPVRRYIWNLFWIVQ